MLTWNASEPTPKPMIIKTLLKNCRMRQFNRGAVLIHEHERSDVLYYLLLGTLHVSVHCESTNQEVVISQVEEGEFVGELGLFRQATCYNRGASVRAAGHVSVAEITHRQFYLAAREDPRLLDVVTAQIVERLNHSNRLIGELTFDTVTSRLIKTLVRLCDGPHAKRIKGVGVQLQISRQMLSKLIGATRERTSKCLDRIEDEGLVKTCGRRILVLNTSRRFGRSTARLCARRRRV